MEFIVNLQKKGLNSKKYIVYEKLNKIGGGKSFDNAKDACKYAKEILADYGFTMFKDNGETWEDVFEAEVSFNWKGGGSMSVYILLLLQLYLCILLIFGVVG